MKLGLAVDSVADLPLEYIKKHNLKVTPLHVIFDETDHIEDETFDLDLYYQQFVERPLFVVKTSQPSPAAFLKNYEALRDEEYDYIIQITVSSGLSGTYNSAVQAAQMFEEENENIPVKVIDTKSASIGERYFTELAIELNDQDIHPDDIVTALEERVAKVKTYLTLPTLKYLRASGRVSTPKFLLGSLLGLKPITYVEKEHGKNEAIGTAFSMNSGVKKVYNLMTENGTKLAAHYSIAHTNDETIAQKMVDMIREKQPEVEIRIGRAGSTISAHTGPGAVALFGLFD